MFTARWKFLFLLDVKKCNVVNQLCVQVYCCKGHTLKLPESLQLIQNVMLQYFYAAGGCVSSSVTLFTQYVLWFSLYRCCSLTL